MKNINLYNKIKYNKNYIKNNDIHNILNYYNIINNNYYNQKYINKFKSFLFKTIIYIIKLKAFELKSYFINRMKNEILIFNDKIFKIEYKLDNYINRNNKLLYKLLYLQEFKIDKETKNSNYDLEDKIKFKKFTKFLPYMIFNLLDIILVNYYI
jgi:hypothetical protein